MKIRTLTALQDCLDKDYSWRIKEIADTKIAVRNTKKSIQSTNIRAGLPLLYAHWEGFVKNAASNYINFVSCQGHQLDELTNNFVVLGAKKHLQNIVSTKSTKLNIEAVDFFRTKMVTPAKINVTSAINTKSNLSSAVFENIALTVGIDHTRYEARYNLIDIRLLKCRNEIAHGEYLILDGNSYRDLADDVISLLKWVKGDIENLASTDGFRYRS